MSIKEDTAESINYEFYKEGGLKDAISKEIDKAIDARVGKWLVGGGVIVLFTMTAAWYTLKADVAYNTARIEQALTTDQAALIIQRLEQLEVVVTKIDERLRLKGI